MKEEIIMPPGCSMGAEFILPEQRSWTQEYHKFIEGKSFRAEPSGLTELPPMRSDFLPHQRDVTQWALRLGKAAAFLGTGMGKTLIELEWASIVANHTQKPVLMLAPLAVAQQTVSIEAPKFGVQGAAYFRQQPSDNSTPIVVTNYDLLERFDPAQFSGVVLDESSILKSFDGATRTALIDAFRNTPYRLCGTATPAPNDYMELGNHAEFLGVMTRTEMLSMFFVHDGGETQAWRLKGHAKKEFWKWVCSWAVALRKPSDIGYDDGAFILPPLRYHEHIVEVDRPTPGMLFAMPAETLQERIAARRDSVTERVEECAAIVAPSTDSWLIWCNLNNESTSVTKSIPECIELTGSDQREDKEFKMLEFARGSIRKLASKASICGYGMNFQVCHKMAFVGINDSWEQFHQAVRRAWRFGQTHPVDVHLFVSSTEGNVLENLKRKEREAEEMAQEMVANMQDLTRMNLRGTSRAEVPYVRDVEHSENWTLHLADGVDLAEEIPSDSIHYSVFSPPFESLYVYSNSPRDMGNSKSTDEFWQHFRFLIAQQFRVMMPGRLVSVHCMNLPTSKVRDGVIGIRDFRGEIIKSYEAAGFIYHSEVCIWKDPVTAMQRTKALGLLHKQLKKDACMSRQGIPDYLCTFRKPGDNPERVTNTNDTFPVKLWQKYADPIWGDIDQSDTLTVREARDNDDERHLCALQLDVIRRAVKLWSNVGDVVWSPFAGIGSEGYVALTMGRRFLGSELKPSYWRQACKNLHMAEHEQQGLFSAPVNDDAEVNDEEAESQEVPSEESADW